MARPRFIAEARSMHGSRPALDFRSGAPPPSPVGLRRSLLVGAAVEAQLLQPVAERAERDAEARRGALLHAARLLEGVEQQAALVAADELVEVRAARGRRRRARRAAPLHQRG